MFKQQKAFKQKNARFYEEDMDLLRHLEGKDFTKYVKELIRQDIHANNLSFVGNGSTNNIDNNNNSVTVSDNNIDNNTVTDIKKPTKRKISRSSLS